MNVLVTAASRHGATTEIADRIGAVLAARGHAVRVLSPEQVVTLDGVRGVVLGSAVYTGGWLKSARHFASRFAGDLADRDLWLFSSGPVGDPLFPREQPTLEDLVGRTGAREHRILPGRLDPSALSPVERLAAWAAHVAPGDYRDWAAVDAWAQEIADALAREDQHSGLPS